MKIDAKAVMGKVTHGAKRNAPTLMLVGATIGFGLTVYEFMKAKPKMDDILAERKAKIEELSATKEDENGDEVPKYSDAEKKAETRKINIDAGIQIAETFGPAVGIGAATIGLMWGANYIHMKRFSSLSKKLADTVAVADISREALEKYKIATKQTVGEEKEKEISEKSDEEFLKEIYQPNKILNSGQGDQLFLDKPTGRIFVSTIAQIKEGVAEITRSFAYEDFIEANVLYDLWGLDACGFGEDHGWMPGQIDIYVKMNELARTPDGRSCIVLDYDVIDRMRYD